MKSVLKIMFTVVGIGALIAITWLSYLFGDFLWTFRTAILKTGLGAGASLFLVLCILVLFSINEK